MNNYNCKTIIDLLWLIEAGDDDINAYLGERSSKMFIKDVQSLKDKLTDKSEVKRMIEKLSELL